MNPNAGKVPLIPIGTAGVSITPAASISSVDRIKAAATKQATAAAQTATFTSPTPPAARDRSSHVGPGRPRVNPAPTMLKGVYFDPPVYQALLDLQKSGRNVSKYINNVVRQALAV